MNSLELFNQLSHQYKGIVISSECIQQSLMSKFGITPAELLRPFLPKKSMRLKLGLKERDKELNIKLLDLKEYDQIGNGKMDKYSRISLNDNLGDINNFQTINKQSTKGQIDSIYEQSKTASYQSLQQVVGDSVGYQYHLNFFDQPILIIYVVSGQEQNVLKELQILKIQSDKLLKLMFQNNIQDLEKIKKVILVLNDPQSVVQYDSVEIINKDYPDHVTKILKYNMPNSIESTNWHRYSCQRYFIEGEVPKKPLAILDDLWTKQYRVIFEELIINLVIPYLERFINILTQQYLETKQKSFDSFLSFLKRTDNQKFENDYQMTQKEAILRYLADHHYLMNDYESAATYYKALVSELKNNKTNIQIPSLNAQEYYLYSRLLCSQKIENLWNIFDEIQAGYQKISFPYMLRIMFFYINTINLYSKYTKDTVFFLQRCHKYFKDEGSKHKPDYFIVYQIMTYEQISFIYLKLETPQFRKFAHNLTLVANRYDSENFKCHSLRCFKIVESLYSQSKWVHILFWLQGHIGSNYIENRKVADAIDAFKSAFNLLNERQPIDIHNQLVVDWKKALSSFEIVNDYRNKFFTHSKLQLNVPQIKGPIDILTFGLDNLPSILNANSTDKNKTKSAWNTLVPNQLPFPEESIIKSYDANYLEERINCFNKWPCVMDILKLNFQDRFNKFARQIFVNDVITLRMNINIPIKVASNISELQVLYQFYTESQMMQDLLDMEENSEVQNIKLQLTELPKNNIQILDMAFQRSVTQYIEVQIKPNKPGYLIITGVSWCFLNIPTSHQIDYTPSDQSKRKTVNFYNKFRVFPVFIPLEIEFNTKNTIVYGEIRPILFKFTNKNDYQIKLQVLPIIAYHFGFQEKFLIIEANSEFQYTFHLRCSFQDDFVGQLLMKYNQQNGGIRIQKIEIPMKVEPSFKICLQTDMTVDYWKFTLQVQDYFGGKGKLEFNRVLCLNQQWELLGDPYESVGNNFNLATFKLCKLPVLPFNQADFTSRLKDQFHQEKDRFNEIVLADDNAIGHQIALDFINLDIKHYFNVFYQKSQNQQNEEFPLFIICRWKYMINNESIYGLHELPVLPQNYFHKNQSELPLSLKIEALQSVKHNFNENPFCSTPVQITFKNTKYVDKLIFKVQLFNGDEPVKNINDIQQPAFLWEGQMNYNIELEPQQSKQLELEAIFSEQGVYDLSRLRILMSKNFKEYYSMDYEQVIIKIQ